MRHYFVTPLVLLLCFVEFQTVRAQVNAEFSFTPTRVCANDTVLCINQSCCGISSLVWTSDAGVFFANQDTTYMTFPNAGNHCITLVATDTLGNSDTVTHCVTVSAPTIAFIIDTPVCYTANGQICATVTNGIPPYDYGWSNGMTGNCIPVSPGFYFLNLIDSLGCNSSVSTNVPSLDLLLSLSSTSSQCGSQGTASVSVLNGSGFYSYQWSTLPIQTTQTATGLTAGLYFVTVFDLNFGCSMTGSIAVNDSSFSVVSTHINTSCPGTNNGSIDLTVIGALGPLTYAWSNGDTTEDIFNLSAGVYSYTVSNTSGCQHLGDVVITNLSPGPSVAFVANSTCNGSNGGIQLTVTGGNPPYNYSWSNGSTVEDLVSVPPGSYTVTVSDFGGCEKILTISLTTTNLVLSASVTNSTCGNTYHDGAINLSISGNYSNPVTYHWSNSQTTQDISNLNPGTYHVTATDANGCTASLTKSVSSTQLPFTTQVTNTDCSNSTGSVHITVYGGIPPFAYLWSNGATSATISNLAADQYVVTVTDANGCDGVKYAVVNIDANCYVTLGGKVYEDVNSDCLLDSLTDPSIANVYIEVDTGAGVFTDNDGNYLINTAPGNYTLTQYMPSGLTFLNGNCPLSNNFSVSLPTGGTSSLNNNFADTGTSWSDLQASLSCATPIPGTRQWVGVTVTNHGSIPQSGYVRLFYDTLVTYYPSGGTAPDSVSPPNHRLSWKFTNLAVNQSVWFGARLTVPQTVILGQTMDYTAIANPIGGDDLPLNNTAVSSDTILSSGAPNYIQVQPRGIGANGGILQTDTQMQYTIHFQNTGNDSTHFITIRDTLPHTLDLLTVIPSGASLPYSLNVVDDSVLVFHFDQIALPDSATNELKSNGMLSFFVQHKGVLPIGTQIKNKAGIYFDYHPAIVTNTALNTIEILQHVNDLKVNTKLSLYPNPASSSITIVSQNHEIEAILITDIYGRKMVDLTNENSRQITIPVNNFSAGIYFLSASVAGSVTSVKFEVIK